MEKFLKPYDMECMRMAMLKHEETFKEQVYELHRLYRIQKALMRNIASSSDRPNVQSPELSKSNSRLNSRQTNQMKLDQEQPSDYVAESSNGDRVLDLMDESEIELSLGPTSYIRKGKLPETPLTSDSGPSFSSSSTGSCSQINRTTSSLAWMKREGEELNGGELGLARVPDMALQGYQTGSKHTSNIEGQLRSQERLKQPPWLFQVLSLNTT